MCTYKVEHYIVIKWQTIVTWVNLTHIKETNQEGGEGEKKDVLGLVPFI